MRLVAAIVRGVATGGVYGYIYPQNQSKYTFYRVKMTSERLLNTSIKFYTSRKNFIPPKNKFLAMPLAIVYDVYTQMQSL